MVSMLKEGTLSGGHHPAARLTAAHCVHVMEKGSTETTVLHVLGMLKDCLANMNTAVSCHTYWACSVEVSLWPYGGTCLTASQVSL